MFVYDVWYFGGLAIELKPGAMARREIAGEPVNVGRTPSGKVFAIRDICPHRAAPLSAGQIIEDGDSHVVECPYHGWTFGTGDGGCKAIPALVEDQKFAFEKISVRTYPVRELDGFIWVYIAEDKRFDGDPDMEPPRFPAARGKPRIVERMTLNCHVDHAVVGLMDPAHGPYVHQQWWWRSAKSIHEKTKKFEARELGFAMAPHSPSSNSYAYKILGGKPITEIVFRLPGIRTEEISIGKRKVLSFTAVTPLDENRTEITEVFFWDVPILTLIKPIARLGVRKFLHQDGNMVDLQQSGLKYDPNLLLVDDADTQAKWYFALKKAWAKHRQTGEPFKSPVKGRNLRWRS